MGREWQALRSSLALLLIVSAGACMAPTPQLATAPESSVALDARIYPPYYGQVAFSVNKAAHVALFEIIPGRGVSLLYPTSGSGFTQVRQNWVPLQYSAQRWLYASNNYSDPGLGQWSGFDYGYGTGYYTPASYRGMQNTSLPRYLFLVASEKPIEVDQFQHDLAGLRQFLGPNEYSSFHPYDVMETLAYAVVPYAGDEQWVTDVFVDWGYDWGYGYTPGTTAAMASWQRIRCADGSIGMAQWVPGWGYAMMTCAPWVNGQQNNPTTPGDSAALPGENQRGRTDNAGQDGRNRAGAGSARPQLQGAQSAETRSRIATLREEATRAQFNDLLNRQLRTTVELRHRADALMERGTAGSNGRASSGSAGRASNSGGRAVRSRAPDMGHQPSAGRSSEAGSSAPRSRAGSSSSVPRTQSAPSPTQSSPPRSRESSPPPSSPTPAPATSTRSRPPAGL